MAMNSRILKDRRAIPRPSAKPPPRKTTSIATVQQLCVMALELACEPMSGEPVPNPAHDPVRAVGMAVCADVCNWTAQAEFSFAGGVFVDEEPGVRQVEGLVQVRTEYELFEQVVRTVQR